MTTPTPASGKDRACITLAPEIRTVLKANHISLSRLVHQLVITYLQQKGLLNASEMGNQSDVN